MKKINIIQIALIIIIVLVPAILLAQPAGGRDPDGAPIDGGLSLLVAAGVGYGAKKMKEKRSKNNINPNI